MACTTSQSSNVQDNSTFYLDPVPMQIDLDSYSSLSMVNCNNDKLEMENNVNKKQKAKRKVLLTASDVDTNLLRTFYELFPNHKFHEMQFCHIGNKQWCYVTISICNTTFFGTGSKHQAAKIDAIKKILLLISEGKINPELNVDLHINNDFFTRDDVESKDYFNFQSSAESPKLQLPRIGFFHSKVNYENARCDPFNELMHLDPNIVIEIIEDTTARGFTGRISLEGRVFESKAITKKEARKNVSKLCLFHSYGVLYVKAEKRVLKRKLPTDDDDVMANKANVVPRYPTSKLKFMYPDAVFSYEEDTKDDAKQVTATITINGEVFIATKPSKPSAGIAAAKLALKSLGCDTKSEKVAKTPTVNLSLNPLVAYQNFYKDNVMTVEASGSAPNIVFTASVTFDDGETLFTNGSNIKSAKADLAVLVFKTFYDIDESSWLYTTPSKRRKLSTFNESTPIENKFNFENNSNPLQHPVMVLNSLNSNVTYEIVEVSSNPPSFEASVKLNEKLYSAVDGSKKAAKSAVAKQILQDLYGQDKSKEYSAPTFVKPNTGDQTMISPNVVNDHPVTTLCKKYPGIVYDIEEVTQNPPLFKASVQLNDETFSSTGSSKKQAKFAVAQTILLKTPELTPENIETYHTKNKQRQRNSLSNNDQNPVAILSRLQAGIDSKYEYTHISQSPSLHEATIQLDNECFSARGSSKKLARAALAAKVLSKVYGMSSDNSDVKPLLEDISLESNLPIDLCNVIESAVWEKFAKVTAGTNKPKVVAGFLIEDVSTGVFDVVSLGTGTKGLAGDKLNVEGTVIIDSHAEVIARRGFCHYLVSEINKCVDGKESILERNTKFSLKQNINIYLYINTAPCGDGRIFCHPGSSLNGSNKAVGMLRTKVEQSQGLALTGDVGPQTLDGILIGDRLQSMTCSDKILKWNVVGVQGALLSNIIEPVYIHGIVIGDLYYHQHLYRALYARGADMEPLTLPYKLNLPLFGLPSTETKRNLGNPLNISVNWNCSENSSEAISMSTGRALIDKESRLSKRSIFKKCKPLLQRYCSIKDEIVYRDFKELAGEYQGSKERLYSHLSAKGAGRWIKKPDEIDMFMLL